MLLNIKEYNLKLEIEDDKSINKEEFEKKVTDFLIELEEKEGFICELIRLYGVGYVLNELGDNFNTEFYTL